MPVAGRGPDRIYTARDVIMRAQEILDVHTYGHNGQCLACLPPTYYCAEREEALRIFYSRYAVLPARRPGGSQPELAKPLETYVALPLTARFGPAAVGTLHSRAVGRAKVVTAASFGLRAVSCPDCRPDSFCDRCHNRGWVWSLNSPER
jgi:hypothetical protein